MDMPTKYLHVHNLKLKNLSTEKLCVNRAKFLRDFSDEILEMTYDQEPRYTILK